MRGPFNSTHEQSQRLGCTPALEDAEALVVGTEVMALRMACTTSCSDGSNAVLIASVTNKREDSCTYLQSSMIGRQHTKVQVQPQGVLVRAAQASGETSLGRVRLRVGLGSMFVTHDHREAMEVAHEANDMTQSRSWHPHSAKWECYLSAPWCMHSAGTKENLLGLTHWDTQCASSTTMRSCVAPQYIGSVIVLI